MSHTSSPPANILPELRELMSEIFEHGESLPDQVYKNMLENCAHAQSSIRTLVEHEKSLATAAALSSRSFSMCGNCVGGCGDCIRYQQYIHKARAINFENLRLTSEMKRLEEENKQLIKRIDESSVPILPSSSSSVCCFKALKEAFERDPRIKAKTARCGCCRENYPIGYGGQNFRSEAQKLHRETCKHTHQTCGRCAGQNRRAEEAARFVASYDPARNLPPLRRTVPPSLI